MKTNISFSVMLCLVLMLVTSTGCIASTVQEAMRDGALAKLNYHIVNSEGMPVSNAFIEVGFYQNKKPGKNPSVKGFTNEEGYFTASKRCMYDVGFTVQKDGFYRSKGHINLTESDVNPVVKDGKWQPYGRDVKIELREYKNPIPLYVFDEMFDFAYPTNNVGVGFDFIRMDWVAPYGKGEESDCLISYSKESGKGYFENKYIVTFAFTNQYAGVCRLKKHTQSVYKSEYYAPTNDVYTSSITFLYDSLDEKNKKDTTLKDDEYLIFRTRTKVNEDGQLVSANYGKIYGPIAIRGIIRFNALYFNLTPNDANIEFDTRQNLNKNGGRIVIP